MRQRSITALLILALVAVGCSGGRPDGSRPDTSPGPGANADPGGGADTPPVLEDPVGPDGGQMLARCTAPAVGKQPELVTLYVFFTCADNDPSGVPVAIPRQVQKEQRTLSTALQEQLKGPTEQERAAGFTSWFSAATAGKLIEVVVMSSGRAIVNFADIRHLISNASTSAGSLMLLQELGSVVGQFKEIHEVEYRFEGSCAAFGEFLQTECTVFPLSIYRESP